MMTHMIKGQSKKRIRFRRRDLILLLERLEMYVSAGLPPTEALSVAGAASSQKQRAALEDVRASLEGGGSLSKNLRERLNAPVSVAGLIEHGEESGGLAKSLASARMILEREDALTKSCISSMAYPSVIAIFAIILTLGLMRGVMPQIIPLLKSLHVQLPLLTRIVIATSEGLTRYGLYALLVCTVVVPAFLYTYKKSAAAHFFCHAVVLRLPIVGHIIRQYTCALMMRSLGSLVESGAALADSYANVIGTMSVMPLRAAFDRQAVDISRGISLGSILAGIKHIPAYIAPLISAGESSGTLGVSLVRAADILDRDIEHALKRLTALVEPVMMAIMGCAVGAIALSIMMPIYDVSRALQH